MRVSEGLRVFRRWNAYLFSPGSAENLGACRVLLYAALAAHYSRVDISAWADVPAEFWMPVAPFSWLGLTALPSSSTIASAQAIWLGALVASSIGILTRLSTACSFVLALLLLGLPNNFGKVHHPDALAVLVLGIMAASRCGAAFSLDRVAGRFRGLDVNEEPNGEFQWPVRAVWIVFAIVFFAAGVSKLRHSGIEWMISDNLKYQLIRHHVSHEPVVEWGLSVAASPLMCSYLAVSSVLFELLAPAALFSRRARLLIVPGLFCMQIGIWLFMGVAFKTYLICYLFWIPWDQLIHSIRIPLLARRTEMGGAVGRQSAIAGT